MLMMNSTDVGSSSEFALLRMLNQGKDRPNVMVMNKQICPERVVEQLTEVCESPVQVSRFPGTLDLSSVISGTLLLADIDQLTIGQQISLSDWLSHTRKDVQVVSITRASMTELIAEGRFLEGLFYRLNTIVLRTIDGHDFNQSW
jgi:transcriptional regulator of aromatic amino acid metabolism